MIAVAAHVKISGCGSKSPKIRKIGNPDRDLREKRRADAKCPLLLSCGNQPRSGGDRQGAGQPAWQRIPIRDAVSLEMPGRPSLVRRSALVRGLEPGAMATKNRPASLPLVRSAPLAEPLPSRRQDRFGHRPLSRRHPVPLWEWRLGSNGLGFMQQSGGVTSPAANAGRPGGTCRRWPYARMSG